MTSVPRQKSAEAADSHRKGVLEAAAKVAATASEKTGRPVSRRAARLLKRAS
ncbi:hypothetical protein ACLQ3C_05905 [Gordonia sp. DT30]|uniref:hypothetical protein n=1 Tax=unclassified Gordonia (in: high G+C Gram-positive bacteria) TaxID=2657482 RepID=UPI003CE8A932